MFDRILQDIEEKMRKSIEALKRELATIRTGHATPSLIEHIKVEYAGIRSGYDSHISEKPGENNRSFPVKIDL